MELSRVFPKAQREKKLGRGLFALQRYDGYERLTRYTMQHGKELPARYLTSVHPHLAWEAMITGEHYPIRALITMASNPLLWQADTHMVYDALKGLDLLVSLEMEYNGAIEDFQIAVHDEQLVGCIRLEDFKEGIK
jgi:anaerobic selenocysteine-containing dehydrogenase